MCLATSGPGAVHLLNGLYDAKLDHQPVVAIAGQTFVRALGGSFQQEAKLLQLYSDVASAYCEQVNTPRQHPARPGPGAAQQAIRVAHPAVTPTR